MSRKRKESPGMRTRRLERSLAQIIEMRKLIAHADGICVSIHRKVDDLKGMFMRRFDPDKPKVTVKGVRARQFFEAVRIRCANPGMSIYEACRLAFGRIRGTAADPGYPSFRALARFARRKRAYFN